VTRLLSTAVWGVFCLYLFIAQLTAPPESGANRAVGWSAIALAVAIDAAVLLLPWRRWKRAAPLWLIPFIFTAVGLNWHMGHHNAFVYGLPFIAIFAVIGATQAPGTSVRLAPVLVVGFLVPLLVDSTVPIGTAVTATILVVAFCIVDGEFVARTMARIRRSEAELAAQDERYRMAFEAAPVGMTQVAPDGTFLHVNGAFAQMMGYEVDELVGRTILDITHPDDRGGLAANVASLLEGDLPIGGLEKRNLRADGTEVWVKQSASLVRDRSGEPLYIFGHAVEITEERSLRQRLAHAAEHDQLTGLPNRSAFMTHLERTLARARAEGGQVALLFMDIDRFKLINDGLGHDVGDLVLQSVARTVADTVRPEDMVARLGGDEFVVVCGGASADTAVRIADRIEEALRRPLPPPHQGLYLTLSIGIAVTGADDRDASLVMRQADTAMYRAKGEGQGRIAVYRTGDVLLSDRRLQTANDLRVGLDRGEFELYFEPVVDLASEQLVCLKAEPRWHHPSQGLLPPSEFMGVAEESDLAARLYSWVLTEVFRQGAAWAVQRDLHGQSADRLNLAVTVSIRQLMDPAFADELAELLATSTVPSILWLEITEDAVLGSGAVATTTIERIRDLGVHLSIKGFGTQRSSLNYLRELPVELVTIDKEFVDHIEEGAVDGAMIEAMLALASSMGVLATAEGVERRSQAAILSSMGCMMAQGPLFGTALSAAQIGAFPSDDLAAWRIPVA
jgi:diguanylate cyclase (GGDEF)-like protein/PAS domain S-box-containing protein